MRRCNSHVLGFAGLAAQLHLRGELLVEVAVVHLSRVALYASLGLRRLSVFAHQSTRSRGERRGERGGRGGGKGEGNEQAMWREICAKRRRTPQKETGTEEWKNIQKLSV